MVIRLVGALGGRAAAVVGALGFYIFVSRELEIGDAGLVFLLVTWVGFVSMVARFGMDVSMLPVYSECLEVGGVRASLRVAARNGVWVGMFALVGGLVVLMAVSQAARGGGFELAGPTAPLVVASLSVVPSAITIQNGALHKCLGQSLMAQVVEGGGGLVFAFVVSAVTAWWGDGIGTSGVLVSVFVGNCVMLSLSWILLVARAAGEPPREGGDAFQAPTFAGSIRLSLPYLGSATVGYLLLWLPSMVMGWAGQLDDVARFNAIARVGSIVTFGLSAVNVLAAPRIASLLRLGDQAELQVLASRTANFAFGFAVTVAACAVVAGDQIMSAFGSGFATVGLGLMVYCGGQLVNAFTGASAYLAQLSGSARSVFRISFVSFATFGVGGCIAGVVYGYVGAVIGVAVAVAVQNLFVREIVKRRIGIASNPTFTGVRGR